MRWRPLFAGAVLGAGLLTATAAHADASRFTGTRFTNPTPGSVLDHGSTSLQATVVYQTPGVGASSGGARIASISIEVGVQGGYQIPVGCSIPSGDTFTYGTSSNVSPGDTDTESVEVAVSFDCNGSYRADGEAESTALYGPADQASFSTVFDVIIPPPDIDAPDLTAEGREVTVSWNGWKNPSPDFLGYAVQRADPGSDKFTSVGGTSGSTTWSDTSVPAAGGEYRYRVYALRGAPGGPVSGSSAPASAITLPEGPNDTTTVPGGDGGGGGGGGGTTTSVPRFRTGNAVPPRVGSSVDLPDARVPGQPAPVGEVDNGYKETLDYSGVDLPDFADEGKAEVKYRDTGKQRGLVVPFAGSLVLVMWALHLRYLNKRVNAASEGPALELERL